MQRRYNRQNIEGSSFWRNQNKKMMLAHLNNIQIKRYILHALSEELLEERNTIYATTEKGRIFLQKYEEVRLYRID
jgi:predicted transcriptional regulator